MPEKAGKLSSNLVWAFGAGAGILAVIAAFVLMKAGAGRTIHYAVFGLIFAAAGAASTYLTQAAVGMAIVAVGLLGGGIAAGFYFWAVKSLLSTVGAVAGAAGASALGSLGSSVAIIGVLIVFGVALAATVAGSVGGRKLAAAKVG